MEYGRVLTSPTGYTAFQDDVLPSGVPVQKGTEVYYISYLMHRDADLYERPDEFDPDRWNTPLLDPFAYVAFHAVRLPPPLSPPLRSIPDVSRGHGHVWERKWRMKKQRSC